MPPFMANESFYESEDSFTLQHMDSVSIGSLLLFSITFLLGLPGNGLVIWVVALKMKRTVNTVWFLHLAVADFVCCLSLPFSIVHLALHQQWPFGWFFCKIIPSAIIFNMFASVFLLTTISIDRCLVVMKPVWCQNHRTVRFASVVCGVTWFLAFIMCFPAFFYPTAISNVIYSDLPDYFLFGNYSGNLPISNDSMAMPFYDELPSVLVSITVTRSIFGFLLPFGIMTACYVLIALKMLRNQFAKSRVKALRVILLVIATFFLCWAPYHVIGVLYLLANPSTALYETLALWNHVSTALAYANSCINPLLYVFVGKKFREKARQTVQGILEGAFSEEGTCSTAFSQERSKSTVDHDIDVSAL
uniref:Complement C3a receptor 1 n=1 Tax=Podarcis muralis TaxID=64176 RepID=A0A670JC98_PODMU